MFIVLQTVQINAINNNETSIILRVPTCKKGGHLIKLNLDCKNNFQLTLLFITKSIAIYAFKSLHYRH